MSKEEKVPDAWDDDWETQVDRQNETVSPERAAKVSKAERLAKHAELNRKLWDSAESTDNFLFLTTKDDVPLKTEFRPAVKVLSRKPAPKVGSQIDPASGMSQLTLEGEEGGEDMDANRKHTPSPEELRLKAQREREEKQRRYEEARERLFGSPATTPGTSSPGTLTPPKTGEGKGIKGKGKGRSVWDGKPPTENAPGSRSKKLPVDTTPDRTSDGRQLYDPGYSAKPDSSFLQRRSVPQSDNIQPVPDEGQQPIRSPRGPDGSGRRGFGFSERAHRGYPRSMKNVEYISGSGSTSLHTLDIFLPRKLSCEDTGRLWVMYVGPSPKLTYIHGGAWRSPDVSMESFEPALNLLFKGKRKDDIAGFASINYRLSPYRQHPTNPSTPDDPARNAKHPDHIHDVLAALRFLQRNYGFGERYLLVGHSCGATLAFQVVTGRWNESSDGMGIVLPLGILGLAGIYDLIRLRNNHCDISMYQAFLEGAFGESEDNWAKASPTSGDFSKSWPGGKLALVVHSSEDELVEKEQATLMFQALQQDAGQRNERTNILQFLETSKHDEIWSRGTPLATMIAKAVGLLIGGAENTMEPDI
ncbi:hypothetical protein GP486_001372 [Trichoglossum hirsutum]|uniref:Kynurenine formamidase n=1 Tax=Trichoglossum hirsutum TaxID=265104 RepID=A0A9P8RSN5_9PEZI|nr:hypothetical protein GP486_001372 [Trichoglossum hirsutum]